MPSDPAFTSTDPHSSPPITGRCYCAQTTLSAAKPPSITTYCHCSSCRRLTGAPLAAFCAFDAGTLDITPAPRRAAPVNDGVTRWFCDGCGTNLAATYDYLPGQVYVPISVIDQADTLQPSLHAHADLALTWLHIDDDLPRNSGSGRAMLNTSTKA